MYKIGLRFTECLLHIELSIYAITPNEISLMGSLILNSDAARSRYIEKDFLVDNFE